MTQQTSAAGRDGRENPLAWCPHPSLLGTLVASTCRDISTPALPPEQPGRPQVVPAQDVEMKELQEQSWGCPPPHSVLGESEQENTKGLGEQNAQAPFQAKRLGG